MKKIVGILMRRDGMSHDDAVEYYKDVMSDVMALADRGDYQGAEDVFSGSFGLEPDYLLNAIM